jgi:uncharacterized protein YjbI with pentapeptide repeats
LGTTHLGYASFKNSSLDGANLAGAKNLEVANFADAKADESTIWPTGFDWSAAGVRAQTNH